MVAIAIGSQLRSISSTFTGIPGGEEGLSAAPIVIVER
jgi:hypothetical protein